MEIDFFGTRLAASEYWEKYHGRKFCIVGDESTGFVTAHLF
jgi:hypothetical protein